MWWWATQQNYSLTFTDWNGASSVNLEVFQVWKAKITKDSKLNTSGMILHERTVQKSDNFPHCTAFFLPFILSRSKPMEPKAASSRRWTTHNRLAVYYRAHTDKHAIHSHRTRQFLAYISLGCGKKLKLNPDKYSSYKLQGPRFKPTLCVRQQCKPLNHCTTLINKLYMITATPLSSAYLC